jgi:hypothetical protein
MLTAPDTPPLVAVIVALPTATAVTTPAELTDATPLLLLDQATVAPEITLPDASRTVATRVTVLPTPIDVADAAMLTDAGVGGGGSGTLEPTILE